MTTNDHEYFEDFEIPHNFITYYANGYVTYSITQCTGGSYEGYAYEILYEKELCHVTITDLWYLDEETGECIEMVGRHNHNEIEQIAEEAIRYEFE